MEKPTPLTEFAGALTARQSRRAVSRRGFTLMECMIATGILGLSAAGISRAMLASYRNDVYSKQQADCVNAGTTLTNELVALPFTSGSPTSVSLADFANYSDTVNSENTGSAVLTVAATKQGTASNGSSGGLLGGLLGGVVGGVVNGVTGTVTGLLGTGGTTTSSTSTTSTTGSTNATPVAKVTRNVTVTRMSTINGGTVANGDLAVVTVDVVTADQKKVRVKRLITSAEAAANATK